MCCVQGHIQVTFVEPYFEEWELKERLSVFDRSFNIREYSIYIHSPNYEFSNLCRLICT